MTWRAARGVPALCWGGDTSVCDWPPGGPGRGLGQGRSCAPSPAGGHHASRSFWSPCEYLKLSCPLLYVSAPCTTAAPLRGACVSSSTICCPHPARATLPQAPGGAPAHQQGAQWLRICSPRSTPRACVPASVPEPGTRWGPTLRGSSQFRLTPQCASTRVTPVSQPPLTRSQSRCLLHTLVHSCTVRPSTNK